MKAALAFLILLGACARSPEEIAAAHAQRGEQRENQLKLTCVRKHGSPEVDEIGTFKGCRYPWSITIGKKQDAPR